MAKPKPKKKKPEEDDDGEEEEAPEEENNAAEEADDRALPGLSFWICLRTHSCMVASFENQLINMFHTCGFSLYQCSVSRSTFLNFHALESELHFLHFWNSTRLGSLMETNSILHFLSDTAHF